MRYVWTDAGDDPSWGIGDEHDIDGYYAPLFDDLTPSVLDEAIRRGHAHGVYFGHNWMPGLPAEALVRQVAPVFGRLVQSRPKLRMMWNLEEHDPDFVAGVLEGWRVPFPKTNTSWSPEGMQGGWMGPVVIPPAVPAPGSFVDRILKCRVRIVPQGFWGAGGGIAGDYAHDMVLRDLTRRGFPESIVSIFHDGKTLSQKRNAEGFVFTMGRLPA